MAKTTMTQLIALATAIEVLGGMTEYTEVVEKLSDMKQTLENKRSTPSKADKARAEENENICSIILDVLTATGKPMTISEIQNGNKALADLSNQKMSALLRKLVDNGTVVRTTEKKKTYFSVV